MELIKRLKGKLTSFQIIILGFAGVILLGALLLMLPIASTEHVVTTFNKTLFTSTSAVCVTGLVLVDTASYWTGFGQAVILILIQIGGLGVITFVSLMLMLLGEKISLVQRQTMQNALSLPQLGGIVKLTKFIIRAVAIVELAGALLLMPVFCKDYGLEGIWMSVFHSISAFCNAGFDLMGTKTGHFSSLTYYQGNLYLSVVIALLIIIGGLGFLTWNDIATKRFKFKEYRMQSKVILVTTLLLIMVPGVILFFGEYKNLPIVERIASTIFQAVTPRTAGFNTADYASMSSGGLMITMILMLIGGSPGSTAGGMKTTTIAVLIANARATFTKKNNAKYFGRRIDDAIIKNAATIFFMYIALAFIGALLISGIENLDLSTCMFESISAIGTVGLTRGITPDLGIISQIILMLLMFFGRVGGLTLIYAAFSRQDSFSSKLPVENIMIG